MMEGQYHGPELLLGTLNKEKYMHCMKCMHKELEVYTQTHIHTQHNIPHTFKTIGITFQLQLHSMNKRFDYLFTYIIGPWFNL